MSRGVVLVIFLIDYGKQDRKQWVIIKRDRDEQKFGYNFTVAIEVLEFLRLPMKQKVMNGWSSEQSCVVKD